MMIVSDVMWDYSRRDKAPMIEASVPPEMQDASESSRSNSRSVGRCPLEREAYVTVDALKNLMPAMTDTIMKQVIKQVKKAMEAANSTRPLPAIHYTPTVGYKPFHRHALASSHHCSDEVREMACPEKDGRSRDENRDWSIGVDAPSNHRLNPARPGKSTTASAPYATHSRHTAWFQKQEQTSKPRGEVSRR